ESNLDQLLDSIDDGMSGASEREIGVWVSGFYGSGKSSFTKYLGYALDDGMRIGNELFRDLFKQRLKSHPLQQRLETVARKHHPTVVLLDLSVDSIAQRNTMPVSSVIFMRVLQWAGYSRDLKLAYLELLAEGEGRLDELKKESRALGKEWDEIHNSPVIGGGYGSRIAMKMYPDAFPTEKSFQNLKIDEAISEQDQVRRMLDLIAKRSGHDKVLFVIDEAGQYVASSDPLVLNLQGFAQNLKAIGKGRAWIFATAQQTLTDDVGALNSPKLFKLKDRFPIPAELKADDIKEITHTRLLSKKPEAKQVLAKLYSTEGSRLNVLTRLDAPRGYATSVQEKHFVDLYPFLPQHFDIMMNIIARLAKSTGGTGLRSAIKVVQETLLVKGSGSPVADRELGNLVTIVDFFDVLRHDLESAPAIRHTVEAVRKTESRFGAESIETRVAKAVAVMQVLEEFTLSRKNLAALLVERMGAEDQTAAVKKAVDALIADKSVPLEEIDGGLRFLSDQAADLQRRWNDFQPTTHEQRQTLLDVLRESVVTGQPKATIYTNKQVKAGGTLTFGDYPVTIWDSSDGMVVDFQFVDPSEFDALRKGLLAESTSPAAEKRIVSLAALDKAVRTHLRDLYASSKMITELLPKTRDADEEEFYRALRDRERNNRNRIADALKIALADGTLIFKGQDLAVKTTAPSFDAAIEDAVHKVGEAVYEKYPHASVTVPVNAAEKIVKASDISTITHVEDPLKLLSGGPSGVFNAAQEAVQDISNYLKSSPLADAKQLLEDFSKAPYGWNKDVTRYVVAAMFVANLLTLRVNSQTATRSTPEVVDAFKSNVAFAKIGVQAPPQPLDPTVTKKAKDELVILTGKSITPIPKMLETAAAELIEAMVDVAREVFSEGKTMGLGVSNVADDLVIELSKLRSADQTQLITAFGDPHAQLPTRLANLKRQHDVLTDAFKKVLNDGISAMSAAVRLPASGPLGKVRSAVDPTREKLESLYADPDLAARQTDIQGLVQELMVALKKAVEEERSRLAEDAKKMASSVRSGADWSSIDEQSREQAGGRLDELVEGAEKGIGTPANSVADALTSLFNARYEITNAASEIGEFVKVQAAKGAESTAGTVLTVRFPAGPMPAEDAHKALADMRAQIAEASDAEKIRFALEE
ncbi:MAG TPA: BREX system P-loop protein BrxC, partial [Spirochaetia bacterium]|nr:BREX system P-loop protein BrxC [Spirochaetia bacterium]